MLRLRLLVDRELDDGRMVVINDSRENASVGVVFTALFAEDISRVGEEFVHKPAGSSTQVGLRLESVEWFRRPMDSVPFGHNAAVQLSGDGLPALRAALADKVEGRSIFLGAD